MDKKATKTNAMRILDAAKIPYIVREYDEEITDGLLVAQAVGTDPEQTFKTLVTQGSDLNYYVFVVPVECKLDVKKAAVAAGVKRVEMIKQKDLFPLTGYVHGGCSPIGMKKSFPTFFSDVALLFDSVMLSGGRRGTQIEVRTESLLAVTGGQAADLI